MSQFVQRRESRFNNINNVNIGLSIPFRNEGSWFASTRTLRDAIIENIKNFLFTNKKERVMRPNFGLSLRNYLFEPNDKVVRDKLFSEIDSGFKQYFPFLELKNVQIVSNKEDKSLNENSIKIQIDVLAKFAQEWELLTFDKIISQ
jgi:phage baseplate assembly protein W